jgi:hypothetical protein
MPTTRHRRGRVQAPSAVVQALLNDEPIADTETNRAELLAITDNAFEAWPGSQFPFLVGWARRRLEQWGDAARE